MDTRREDPIVHFYETFLTQYDPKLRELRGVYYTPEPVVSYIVRSVDYLLREYFDCSDGLADTSTVTYTYIDDEGKKRTVRSPRVLLLDPACGTGTFSYAIIDLIRETYRKTGNAGMWSGYVREHLLRDQLICQDDLNLYQITDDTDQAVKIITRFYRNFHSTRFVKDLFVIRLKHPSRSSCHTRVRPAG